MDRFYYYLFYGSFTLMPILLLLILITQQRCRVWAKRCARKLDIINDTVERVKYSAESAITRYLSDSVPDKMHGLISEMVEKHFRENVLPCELRPEDVEFGSPYKEPEIFPKESFDINDFPTMEPELQEKLRPAIETIVFEEGYADKYINRPSFNLNGIGMKRVALSPEHWTKLVSLGFVNEEPVSVSAIVHNILAEHFDKYGKEIGELVIIGDRNKKYGYGRN